MESLYVIDHGLHIKRRSERLVIKKAGRVLEEIPVHGLQRVVVFGRNQFTTDVLRLFAANGVDVAFLSEHGRFSYRLVPQNSKNVYLRLAQNGKYREEAFRVQLGRLLVGAKIHNQRALLVRYRRQRDAEEVHHAVEALQAAMKAVEEAQEMDRIRGIEGHAAKIYFAALSSLLKHGFTFSGRRYHPSPDPVNAMLSFGYTLVTNEITGLMEAHGFDVHLGFFHGLRYGRASLATDLLEEFRAPVVDRLILYLINKRVVEADQFRTDKPGDCRMNEKALRTFLNNYERFVTSAFVQPATKEKTHYRALFRLQVCRLERTLLKEAAYEPYLFY
uniref:CRISPR-associated endonuclease Cas1 n=1 Tax=Desulfacinum infernum TaxID=35837 RepID=A0A831ZL28_9BACT